MIMLTGKFRIPALALAFAVSACGSADTSEVTTGANGAPQGDTGWTMSKDGEKLRLQRQLDRLTLSYVLAPGSEGPRGTVRAVAEPCLGGKGKQQAEDEYTASYFDDASAITDIRGRFDGVVGRIGDLCDVPRETLDEIQSGFDGLYFRSASDRAAIAGQ